MIVLDASVAAKWLIPEPGADEAVAHRLLVGGRKLISPALVRIEVAGAILRCYRDKRLNEELARSSCGEWAQILSNGTVHLVPDEELFEAAIELAFTARHALQDCFYLALGKAMNAAVVTADDQMATRGNKAGIKTILLNEYQDGNGW